MHATTLTIATILSALGILTGINIFTTYLVVKDSGSDLQASRRQYTYIAEDYPEHWPLPPMDPVALVVEEPSHYTILGADAREEWATSTPKGFGYIRLGPEYRSFAVSMFHEYHCLRVFRAGLAGDYSSQTSSHIGHCLVYLRQMILCSPDLTLEPYNSLERDFEVERAGATHVCQDWRQVYEEMENNWKNWVHVRSRVPAGNTTTAASSMD